MFVLAIETSTTSGSVALLDGETCLVERTLELGQAHGQSLIPGIQQLLSERGILPRDCGMIAVSIGPGSFTGLRVGVVCAKTWAYATRIPAVGVPTFAAIAENATDDVLSLQVIADAQRGDLFVGHFHRQDCAGQTRAWATDGKIEIVAAETWAARLTATDAVSGPGVPKVAELIAGRTRVLDADLCQARASWIGRLGFREAQANRLSDPWKLEPLYLRRSSAEDKWDARELAQRQQEFSNSSGGIP